MEIKVEGKNKKYAKILQESFCGMNGNLSEFLLLKYEYIVFCKTDNSLALNVNKLSNDVLAQLEIIGKLIYMLGENPELIVDDKIYERYLCNKQLLLETNVKITKEKIILYTNALNSINDNHIKTILEKLIVDERKNLKIFELLNLKNKMKKYNLD